MARQMGLYKYQSKMDFTNGSIKDVLIGLDL